MTVMRYQHSTLDSRASLRLGPRFFRRRGVWTCVQITHQISISGFFKYDKQSANQDSKIQTKTPVVNIVQIVLEPI
jgi:hypothetical protein